MAIWNWAAGVVELDVGRVRGKMVLMPDSAYGYHRKVFDEETGVELDWDIRAYDTERGAVDILLRDADKQYFEGADGFSMAATTKIRKLRFDPPLPDVSQLPDIRRERETVISCSIRRYLTLVGFTSEAIDQLIDVCPEEKRMSTIKAREEK